jgi:hypothetical protein
MRRDGVQELKRIALLLVPVLSLLAVGAVVVAKMPTEAGLPATCQLRLNQYVAHISTVGTATVQRTVRATKPGNLGSDAGYPTFGDSVYYQTEDGPAGNEKGGAMPLPYPPKELWCVLLKQQNRATGRTSYPIVFVGLHMDMYSADWIVHEGPGDPSTPGVLDSLSQLGCELGLDEAGPRQADGGGG